LIVIILWKTIGELFELFICLKFSVLTAKSSTLSWLLLYGVNVFIAIFCVGRLKCLVGILLVLVGVGRRCTDWASACVPAEQWSDACISGEISQTGDATVLPAHTDHLPVSC